MPLTELIPILQVSIGPTILVSGVGLLLLSMTNRLGRIVDRTRQLADGLPRTALEERDNVVAQLGILDRPGPRIRSTRLSATRLEKDTAIRSCANSVSPGKRISVPTSILAISVPCHCR